jgi:acyl-CoA thioesterase
MVLTELQEQGIAAKLKNNPVVDFVGVELVKVTAGQATLRLPYREELHNSMGVVQGGILGVLADVTGGVSLYSVLTDPAKVLIPTVEFKLNFLRPASGEDVFGHGKVAHRGRQIAVCQVDIATGAGVLLAKGLFTYMIKHLNDA